MIKTFVLIVVLGHGQSQGGVSSVSAEFNSQDACLHALNSIINETNKSYITRVIGSGCFPKE
jgi:hypothetical protein